MRGLGLRACARELDINHAGLLKAFRTGRVQQLPDGSYDPEACRIALKLNSHPVKSSASKLQSRERPKRKAGPPVVKPIARPIVRRAAQERESEPDDISPEDLGQPPTLGSIAEAARQLEWEKVRALKQKTDKEEAVLVELIPMNAKIAGMIIWARERLTRIGAELADRLAREPDPVKCRALVDDQIVQALENLKEYQPV